MERPPEQVIDLAIVIADALGDDFDVIPYDKAEWIKERGGEPFRDVNLPFQRDYLTAAKAAIRHLTPTDQD